MTKPQEEPHPYYRWVEQAKTRIVVSPMAEIFDPATVKRLRNYARRQQCFLNAYSVADAINCNVAMGQVKGYIEHAWNELDGKHFDVTAEKFKIGFEEYDLLKVYTMEEYSAALFEVWEHDFFPRRLWRDEVQNGMQHLELIGVE